VEVIGAVLGEKLVVGHRYTLGSMLLELLHDDLVLELGVQIPRAGVDLVLERLPAEPLLYQEALTLGTLGPRRLELALDVLLATLSSLIARGSQLQRCRDLRHGGLTDQIDGGKVHDRVLLGQRAAVLAAIGFQVLVVLTGHDPLAIDGEHDGVAPSAAHARPGAEAVEGADQEDEGDDA